MSTTLSRKDGGFPVVDADWYAFCQALYKGIEGEDWEEMYDSYKAMSKASGVNKPQEAQKAKALWAMKAAKDRKEEFCDRAHKDNILGRNTTRLELWEEHFKDPIVALDRALKCVEDWYQSWLQAFVEARQQWHVIGWCRIRCYRCGTRSCGLFWMLGLCAQPPRTGMSQEIRAVWRALLRLGPSIRPHGELVLLLMKKKPTWGWFSGPRVEGRK